MIYLLLLWCHVEWLEFAGVILFWWHLSELRVKLVIKWLFICTFATGIWLLSECHTKLSLKNVMQNWKIGDRLKLKVINDSLNESCNDSVVRIGTFCHTERCDSQRHTVEIIKNALGYLPVERQAVRSTAYWQTGDGTCLMLQLFEIMIIIWWWQTLGKDYRWVR